MAAGYEGMNEPSVFIDLFRNLLTFVDPPLEQHWTMLLTLLADENTLKIREQIGVFARSQRFTLLKCTCLFFF